MSKKFNTPSSPSNTRPRSTDFDSFRRSTEAIETSAAQLADTIDLSVENSPVLMWAGDSVGDAVEVGYRTGDGRYIITSPYRVVTVADLKIMRARFLVTRGDELPVRVPLAKSA